jgi:hypothetical protein
MRPSRGRYIRRSTRESAIGITEEVGVRRIRKKRNPKHPSG